MSEPADDDPGGAAGGEAVQGSSPGPGLVLPRPDEIPQRERDDAMGAYLMMFASWAVGLPLPFLNLVASFVYYIVNRRSSRFVAFHSFQALIVHLPVAVYNALLMLWLVVALISGRSLSANFLPALVLGIALNLGYIFFSVLALRRASKGIFYYIPWFGRIAFGRFYGARARERELRRAPPASGNSPPPGFRP
jgi:uncharacterized Tic20 family protein